jgi:hypothetical protein
VGEDDLEQTIDAFATRVSVKNQLPAGLNRATLQHQGEHTFAVWLYCADNAVLLANEIGPASAARSSQS